MKIWRSRFGVATLACAAIALGFFGGRPLLQNIEFARAENEVQVTRQQLSTMEDLSTVFRHVGVVVGPSVVEIQVHKTIKESSADNPEDDMIRHFFQQHGGSDFQFQFPDNGIREYEQSGTGSGVIMDAGDGYGYILTNNHVAGNASEITVTLSDGRKFDGSDVKLLGTDPKSNLAVVQIKADRLIPATWGNSDELEKGDWILAFGCPFGYVGSMTHGIVSALNRNPDLPDPGLNYENFIQVDAPINPGNSGGPLVNIRGEVVGINTAIATMNGGFQGIGFAIPSNQAKTVYTDLKEHGKVVRGWLGVSIKNVADDPLSAKLLQYSGTTGVIVEQTFPNTPAIDKLQAGDIIVGFNGQAIDNVQQLRNRVADTAPDAKVSLKVIRDHKEQTIELTVGSQPEDLAAVLNGGGSSPESPSESNPRASEAAGLSLQTLDAQTASKLGIAQVKSGAVITAVAQDSTAAKAGLRPGVVITRVGSTPVHNAQEAADALGKADLKQGVLLYITTREGSEFVSLQSK